MQNEPEFLNPGEVLRGANKVTAAVARAFGPRGKLLNVPGVGRTSEGRVLVERPRGLFTVGEEFGAKLMRELSETTFKIAGDGASRSVIMGNAVLRGAVLRMRRRRFDPKEFARGIDIGFAKVTRELERQRIPVVDPVEAARFAAISVRADREIGELLGLALDRVDPEKVSFVLGTSPSVRFDGGGATITLANADGTRVARAFQAKKAAKEMLAHGAILGGGVGLAHAAGVLEHIDGTAGEIAGVKVFREAIRLPAELIAGSGRKHGIDPVATGYVLDPFSTVSASLTQVGQFGLAIAGRLAPAESSIYVVGESAAPGRPRAAAEAPREAPAGSGGRTSGAGGGPPNPPTIGVDLGALTGPPKIVQRFTDVLCPRQVSIATPRFAVVVGLTIEAESPEAKRLDVETAKPVSVTLTSQGVEPIGKSSGTLIVQVPDDEPSLAFKYRPVDVGNGYIRVEYMQGGHSLASVLVPIEVVEREVIEGPSRTTTEVRDAGDAAPADWRIYVRYDSRPQTRSLHVEVARGDGPRKAYKEVPLYGALESELAEQFKALENLQAGGTNIIDQKVRGEVNPIGLEKCEKEIARLGYWLWDHYLPEDFRRQYYADREAWCGASAIIYTNEPSIPWELTRPYRAAAAASWDAGGPWCHTMRLTRWLLSDEQPEGVPGTPPLSLRFGGLTMVVPETSGLEFAPAEREYLSGFRDSRGLADWGVNPVTDDHVLTALEKPYDWVHVAAHGKALSDTTGEAPLLLDRGSLKPSDMVGPGIATQLLKAPSFVFNACQVGKQKWRIFGSSGWATQLIGRGAGMLIAPLWSISDEPAHRFVRAFYDSLAEGKTIGEAMLAGREQARRQGDPTWLAYALYAHPNARVDWRPSPEGSPAR